ADVTIAITFGEIRGESELRGSDAAADNGSPNGELAGSLLGNDAQMITVNLGGGWLGSAGSREYPSRDWRAARKESAVQPCSRKRYLRRALSRDWRRTSLWRKSSVMARTTGMA